MFKKVTEDFVCEHCGREVVGNGYTNHCPHCLWSKHVDIQPGDRAASCGGMMEPVTVQSIGGDNIITHRCSVCHYEKRNKMAPEDNYDTIVTLG